MLEESLYALLSADATLTSLVTRIQPDGPEIDIATPFLTYGVSDEEREGTLDGPATLVKSTVQFDFYSTTHLACLAIGQALLSLLDYHQGADFRQCRFVTRSQLPEIFDFGFLYHGSQAYEIWWRP